MPPGLLHIRCSDITFEAKLLQNSKMLQWLQSTFFIFPVFINIMSKCQVMKFNGVKPMPLLETTLSNLQLHFFHIDLNFGLVATGPAGSNFTAFIDYIYSHMYKHTCLIVWLGRLGAACLLLMAGPDTVMGMAYAV